MSDRQSSTPSADVDRPATQSAAATSDAYSSTLFSMAGDQHAAEMPIYARDDGRMPTDPIDAILASYEQSLSRGIDAAVENASVAELDLQAWRATKDRIRSVLEETQSKLMAADHRVGITEGDDLIEITFGARTSPRDRNGGSTFERKHSGVLVKNFGPDKLPVGGGMQTHVQLTEARIRDHVAASLGKTLDPNA